MKVKNPINEIDPDDPLDWPVYVTSEGIELPEKGTYYVIAQNGFFIHKDTGIVRAFVPVQALTMLKPLEVRLELKLPPLDKRTFFFVKAFFHAIYAKHKTESIVLLLYSVARKEYSIYVPEQSVGPATIKYEPPTDIPQHLKLVGTIHSHCAFGAFHSGTDQNDEANFDGIHITVGHVNQEQFSLSCTIAIQNQRSTISPLQVIEGIVKLKPAFNNYNYIGTTYSGAGSGDSKYEFNLRDRLIRQWHQQFERKLLAQWEGKVKPIKVEYFCDYMQGWRYWQKNPQGKQIGFSSEETLSKISAEVHEETQATIDAFQDEL